MTATFGRERCAHDVAGAEQTGDYVSADVVTHGDRRDEDAVASRNRNGEEPEMPRHQERAPSALARGTAKSDDIERARRDVTAAEPAETRLRRRLDEVDATTARIRDEVNELEGIVSTKDVPRA
jgi:hypothetical protein